MSKGFDPYHEWLGIRANESPPNHYRLLGIPLFESDTDVIRNGLAQRMTHLNSFASGAHSALSQRLLREVARAALCLLRPDAKLIYDRALQGALVRPPENCCLSAVSAKPQADAVVAGDKLVDGASAAGGQESPPSSELDFGRQFDQLDAIAAPSIAVRARKERGKQRRSSTRTVVSIAGIILSGVIGLAAGGFVLLLIDPENPLAGSLVGIFHSSDKVPNREPPTSSRPNRPPKPGNRRPAFPPLPPDTPTEPENDRSEPPPAPPDTSPKASDPQPPPQDPDRSHDAPKAAAASPPKDIHKEIVLDLSHPVKRVALPEVAKGSKAEVRVEDVANLGTPHELKPSHGVLRFGQPVDIVFTNYAGIRIRLSLRAGEGTIVEVAPEMDDGQRKKIPFTQQRVQQLCVSWNKDADKLSQQLSEAKNEAQNIDIWLKSPGTKPLQLRGARTQRLLVLNQKMIPALEQQMSGAQARGDVLQGLSRLVEQIHGTASIHLVIRSEAEDGTPESLAEAGRP
jgi:hypothetical protein